MARVTLILGVFALFTAPSVFCDHDKPEAGTIICGHGEIIRGQPATLQELCNGKIHVSGINNRTLFTQASFPFTFTVELTEEGGSPISVSSQVNYDVLTDDNIAGHVTSEILALTQGECDNRGIMVSFSLTNSDSTKVFQRKMKRRIMCDFSGIDLALTATGIDPTNPPMIILSDTVTTLAEAMTQGFDFTLSASNIGSGAIPMLTAPPDELGISLLSPGIFLSAFIKPDDGMTVYDQEECMPDMDYMLPEITGKDLVVESVYFSSDSGLAEIDILSTLRANTMPLELCGDHILVLFIDPLHTAWNEENRCNNFLTVPIHSTRTCYSAMPQCEVTMNPWSPGDMRAIFRGGDTTGPVTRMFQFEDDGFRETYNYDWVEKHGYGRLAIFTDYIKRNTDTATCDSFPGAKEQLEKLEGDDTGSEDLSTITLPDKYSLAKTKMAQLVDPDAAQATMAEMESELGSMPTMQQGSTIGEKVRHNISITALQTVLNATQKILSGSTTDMGHNYCQLPRELEWSRWLHNANKTYIEHDVIRLAGKIAAVTIMKPGWTCLETLLKHVIKYADTADSSDLKNPIPATFFFDDQSVQIEGVNRLERCGDTNKCIRKLHANCKMEMMAGTREAMDTNSDEICKMFILKRTAKALYKALGMVDLIQQIHENDEMEGNYCGKDPLEPEQGPVTLWRFKDETNGQRVLSVGIPDAANDQIVWSQKAVCRCTSCGEDSTLQNTATEVPLRKRRK